MAGSCCRARGTPSSSPAATTASYARGDHAEMRSISADRHRGEGKPIQAQRHSCRRSPALAADTVQRHRCNRCRTGHGNRNERRPLRGPCAQNTKVCTVTFPPLSFPACGRTNTSRRTSARSTTHSSSTPCQPNLRHNRARRRLDRGSGTDRIAITKILPVSVSAPALRASGAPDRRRQKYPDSSATNWTIGSNSYRVVLHCVLGGLFDLYPAGDVNPSRRSD